MGYIFKGNEPIATVGELLDLPEGKLILSRLQAGRVELPNGSNIPHRLSKADFEKLKDEEVRYALTNEGAWAMFLKPVNEIRAILGLQPQSQNPFDLF